jgi:hypothetical protein
LGILLLVLCLFKLIARVLPGLRNRVIVERGVGGNPNGIELLEILLCALVDHGDARDEWGRRKGEKHRT